MMKQFKLTVNLALLFSLLFCQVALASNIEDEAKSNHTKPSIIALAPHIVEMLYDIGAGNQIIGTTEFSNYPEQAKSIPRIGNYMRLQIERIVELQPDFIIAWKSGSPSDDLTKLRQLGFTIIYSQPNTFEDIAEEVITFSKLTGHKNKGKELAAKFLKKLAQIKNQFSQKNKITSFYELWSRPLSTIAKGSWPQQHLTICSAKNPFEQASTPYPQVNIEQVMQSPIDLIIQPLSHHQKEREVFNWRDWGTIAAVKNNRIIQPDADALHRMTLRSLDELQKLCEAIDKVRQSL